MNNLFNHLFFLFFNSIKFISLNGSYNERFVAAKNEINKLLEGGI